MTRVQYVCCVSQSIKEIPLIRGWWFWGHFVSIVSKCMCASNSFNAERFEKVIVKIKRCCFFTHSVLRHVTRVSKYHFIQNKTVFSSGHEQSSNIWVKMEYISAVFWTFSLILPAIWTSSEKLLFQMLMLSSLQKLRLVERLCFLSINLCWSV